MVRPTTKEPRQSQDVRRDDVVPSSAVTKGQGFPELDVKALEQAIARGGWERGKGEPCLKRKNKRCPRGPRDRGAEKARKKAQRKRKEKARQMTEASWRSHHPLVVEDEETAKGHELARIKGEELAPMWTDIDQFPTLATSVSSSGSATRSPPKTREDPKKGGDHAKDDSESSSEESPVEEEGNETERKDRDVYALTFSELNRSGGGR